MTAAGERTVVLVAAFTCRSEGPAHLPPNDRCSWQGFYGSSLRSLL